MTAISPPAIEAPAVTGRRADYVPQPPALLAFHLCAVFVPPAALVVAIVFLWGHSFGGLELALLLGVYALCGFGVTIGFHRLFTHRSFETTRPIKLILGILGSMTVEGKLLRWVAIHRRHHAHSDTEHDPHSPSHHGGGFVGVVSGWWHAHVGWLFEPDSPELMNYVTDLQADPWMKWVSEWFYVWVALGLILPAALTGWATHSWNGALHGFVWGGIARVMLGHHLTWSINSVCHMWGARPYRSDDDSRNNPVFGVLSLGEGWHNNHHAFPTSARHGLRWWQLDLSYYLIRLMEVVGLAWKVKLPTPHALAAKCATGSSA